MNMQNLLIALSFFAMGMNIFSMGNCHYVQHYNNGGIYFEHCPEYCSSECSSSDEEASDSFFVICSQTEYEKPYSINDQELEEVHFPCFFCNTPLLNTSFEYIVRFDGDVCKECIEKFNLNLPETDSGLNELIEAAQESSYEDESDDTWEDSRILNRKIGNSASYQASRHYHSKKSQLYALEKEINCTEQDNKMKLRSLRAQKDLVLTSKQKTIK